MRPFSTSSALDLASFECWPPEDGLAGVPGPEVDLPAGDWTLDWPRLTDVCPLDGVLATMDWPLLFTGRTDVAREPECIEAGGREDPELDTGGREDPVDTGGRDELDIRGRELEVTGGLFVEEELNGGRPPPDETGGRTPAEVSSLPFSISESRRISSSRSEISLLTST